MALVGLCYLLAFAMRSNVGGLFPGPFGSSGLTDGVSASAASLCLLVPATGFRLAIVDRCAAPAKRFCALEGALLFTGGFPCWGYLLGISVTRRSFRRPVRGCRAVPRILILVRGVHRIGIPVPLSGLWVCDVRLRFCPDFEPDGSMCNWEAKLNQGRSARGR